MNRGEGQHLPDELPTLADDVAHQRLRHSDLQKQAHDDESVNQVYNPPIIGDKLHKNLVPNRNPATHLTAATSVLYGANYWITT